MHRVDATSSRPVTLRQDGLNAVISDKLSRHTVGRISMLARVPIYLIGVALQSAKIVLKLVVGLPAATLFNFATDNKHEKNLKSLTLNGLGKDSLMLLKLVDKMGSSILCFVFAPPRRSIAFKGALERTFEILSEGYHNRKIDDILQELDQRPDYSLLIGDNNGLSYKHSGYMKYSSSGNVSYFEKGTRISAG